jgi:putative transposase
MTTKRYVDEVKKSDWSIFPKRSWQRNYWEHVIRNEKALDAFRRYIAENPLRWDIDRYNAKPLEKTNFQRNSGEC